MQIEVVYVERPVGDRQLGKELWRHVDQVGAVDGEVRSLLRRNGLRVGVVGANPPLALQRMLGLQSDWVSPQPGAEEAKQLVGRRFYLISGAETDIQVSQVYPECAFNVASEGPAEPRRFENATCKFRVRAVRIQDGWARLEVEPQMHHGDDHLRPAVGEEGWRFKNGQQTEPFYLQRFDVKLGTGDMAIVTAEDDAPGTMGQVFFRGPAALKMPRSPNLDASGTAQSAPPDNDYPIQRLLIIRLAAMDDAQPVFADGR